MRKFPEAIQNCVASFSRLPGVGPRTALRYVFYLLQQPKHDLEVMARTINALTENIFICNICFTYTEKETCSICLDQKRDTNILCIVEASRDIATISTICRRTGDATSKRTAGSSESKGVGKVVYETNGR